MVIRQIDQRKPGKLTIAIKLIELALPLVDALLIRDISNIITKIQVGVIFQSGKVDMGLGRVGYFVRIPLAVIAETNAGLEQTVPNEAGLRRGDGMVMFGVPIVRRIQHTRRSL